MYLECDRIEFEEYRLYKCYPRQKVFNIENGHQLFHTIVDVVCHLGIYQERLLVTLSYLDCECGVILVSIDLSSMGIWG